jgi:hypothetical protein
MSKLFDSIEAKILNRVAIREKLYRDYVSVNDRAEEDESVSFKDGLRYSFEFTWHYRAVCENSQVVQEHKVRALRFLKYALYEDIRLLVYNLEHALYDYDLDQAQKILADIQKEIG